MELKVLEAQHAPSRPVVAISMGSVRRQVKMEVNRSFQIPPSSERGVQMTLFELLASKSLPLLKGPSAEKEVACDLPVPLPSGETTNVKLRLRPVADPQSNAKKGDDARDPCEDAKEYLERHKLQQRIQDLIQEVLSEQPEEPYNFMLRSLRKRALTPIASPAAGKAKPKTPAAPLVPKPPDKPCPSTASPKKVQDMQALSKTKVEDSADLKQAAEANQQILDETSRLIGELAGTGPGASEPAKGIARGSESQRAARAYVDLLLKKPLSDVEELRRQSGQPAARASPGEHHSAVRHSLKGLMHGALKIVEANPDMRKECLAG